MKRILYFGDSNTWGYVSGSVRQRLSETERWTKLLQAELGAEYEVIEEGLNSRTLFTENDSKSTRDGREKLGRCGYTYLFPCMDSHDKFDVFVLMLGTNELKADFSNSPSDIVKMIGKFAEAILSYKSQIDGSSPWLIFLACRSFQKKHQI